jgi:hypothetical protein
VNLNGTYNVNGFFNYGFPIKKPKSNLNLMANVSRSQTQTLINSLSNYTRNTKLGGTISWTTNIKEGFDMNFSSNSNLTMARYTLQPTQNGDFFTQTVSAEATVYSKRYYHLILIISTTPDVALDTIQVSLYGMQVCLSKC